ncbi:putative ATP-dependent DNA DEAD/DEAH box helicase [Trypanosoma cruzi]|uniref:Putative ATP-dependent DNA DEAD/DEAH box helicase n=1 Tax=Trypanosoma cruzi TaxID=5693 RepID=A0A2V2ULX9_TRYCR|nr:putative ATP-dependent DNA DEAD/DEAH box helicase [Trypanosoma cruzi]
MLLVERVVFMRRAVVSMMIFQDFHKENVKCVVESTRIGRAMARRYVLLKTVEQFHAETTTSRLGSDASLGVSGEKALKPPKESNTLEKMTGAPVIFTLPQILGILSRAAEFEELHLRQGDRKHLNEINKNIRYPLKSGMRGGREVREDWHKVYVLLQAHLEHMPISDFSLRNDSVRLWTTAPRLARFLVDYASAMNSYSFMKESSLLFALHGAKDVVGWSSFEAIGWGRCEIAAKALLRGGIRDFADVLKSDPRKLEISVARTSHLAKNCRIGVGQYRIACFALSLVRVLSRYGQL